MDKKTSRRDFIKASLGTIAAASLTKLGCSSHPSETTDSDNTIALPPPQTQTRPLGRTGYNVRLFSLGGQATLERPNQDQLADQIINTAIDLGVNYIDTSHAYGGGSSETYIGRVMKTRRNEAFLATKTLQYSYDGAMTDLETSLRRLQTDQIDLWQLHNVREKWELDQIFGTSGAIKAFEKAKLEGTTRFIGITGHYNPAIIDSAISDYYSGFDTVLMAINAADVHYRSFIRGALPTAVNNGMGIIAMKIAARGNMFREDGITTMEQAMGYTLTHPVSTVIIGCSSVADVANNVRVAENFKPFTSEQMTQLEELTRPYQRQALFYKYEW